MERRECCLVGCDKLAEFEIYAEGEGLDPYCNITDACTAHVGELLGTFGPDWDAGKHADHWWVVPIAEVAMEKHEVFQALYDSEINFNVSCFWDGGFDWAIGDLANGWRKMGHANTWNGVAHALAHAACERWPESDFAKRVPTLAAFVEIDKEDGR